MKAGYVVDWVTVFDRGTTTISKPQSIYGVVVDLSGALVPNAQIILTNTDTKVTISITTDQGGNYIFGNFDPGTYSVTVRALGFKQEIQPGIQVAANESRDAGKMVLMLGAVAESITVTGSRSPSASTVLGPMTTLPPSQPMRMSNSAAIEELKTLTSNYQAQYGQRASGVKPQRVGGMVTAANLINFVRPVYPAAQQSAGIQGTVKFEAILGKDGTLHDLQAVSSPDPGLTQVSLDTLKSWHFKPTTLNGEPVETTTVVDVNFTLTN